MSINLEVIDDFAYFVSDDDKLVRLDLVGIHQQTSNGRKTNDKLLYEQIVCEDVRYICSHGKSLTILTHEGVVSNLDTLDNRLDLSAACGKPYDWTAIGRRGNKAVAAGYYDDSKLTRFVLVDLLSMTVTDTLDMPGVRCNHRTSRLRILEVEDRTFVVACRDRDYIDVIEISGSKMSTNMSKMSLVGSHCDIIYTLVAHPTKANTVLVAGNKYMAAISIRL